MKPETLPDRIRNDPKMSAECAVFDALRQSRALDGAVVYHSLNWHSDVDGFPRDGEVDFLVAHPEWGFLSLEVKGGRIGFDAGTDSWTSTDRKDRVHNLNNPFKQAAKSKRAVLAYLRDAWPGRSMPFVNARHGVIFPHSEAAGRLSRLPAYAPEHIVACSDHMAKLGSRVAGMMIHDSGTMRTPRQAFGATGMSVIDGFMGRDVDLQPIPETRVLTVDRRIVELTERQNRYLSLLSQQPVAIVEGGAGTGKTLLAMEQARRWSADRRRVLFLCFNGPLSEAVQRAMADTGVGVSTFHDFCSRTVSAHGLDMDAERRSYRSSWLNRLPGHLEEVAVSGPDALYDAVIVDEAQDFKATWIEALEMFVAPQGRFWCFRDDGQNVQFGDELLDILDVHPFTLSENVRNAQPIFEESKPLRTGPEQVGLGPPGPDVERVDGRGGDLTKTVVKTVNGLITRDRIPALHIAVLLETVAQVDAVSAGLSGVSVARADKAWSDGLVVDTVRRFKGLDRPVVVLATRGEDPALDYVGVTRARGRLLIVEHD